ncbi:hypothetical protein AFR_17890 [Actinoplanes friuliensis DSM 7358]|uniref:Uncharacterized protein n=1 Tax=Actinoplanes friuliensis DSM 7358 TaxID=1246995 RepID=U5W1Q5_9ACTN|nr:hypothetical protein AFR_17890 [Actinoplanes friuliensis DSM 7358]
MEFVTDLAGPAGRLCTDFSAEQATMLSLAAAADTIRAVQAMPGWAAATGSLAEVFAGDRRWPGPVLLIATEIPQLGPDLLVCATDLLRDFDAVLGPTTGDGWWAFGLREPARVALGPLTGLGLLNGLGSLTVAALRLGLRVAMLPTLRGLGSGADVRPVAAHCPAGSMFATTVAQLTGRTM